MQCNIDLCITDFAINKRQQILFLVSLQRIIELCFFYKSSGAEIMPFSNNALHKLVALTLNFNYFGSDKQTWKVFSFVGKGNFKLEFLNWN